MCEQEWKSARDLVPSRSHLFPTDLNYPGSFSCQGQRAIHSINQTRVRCLECPPRGKIASDKVEIRSKTLDREKSMCDVCSRDYLFIKLNAPYHLDSNAAIYGNLQAHGCISGITVPMQIIRSFEIALCPLKVTALYSFI